jgi:2-methylcitrate dehydratase PrpD
MAGLLAAQGFTSSAEVLAHKDGGIFNAYSDGGAPEAVTAELGSRWELEQIGLRLWPAASSIQTVISSLFALMQAHELSAMNVAAVRVGLSKTVYDMHGTLAWNDKFKALLSTPYVTSIVLHDRRCWLEQFEAARFRDAAVDAFARERVKVEIDPRVEGTGAAIEIRTIDGAVHTDRRAAPKGDPSDPLTRAEIEEKLRTAAVGFLSDEAVERITALVGHLERLANVRELLGAVRPDGGSRYQSSRHQ